VITQIRKLRNKNIWLVFECMVVAFTICLTFRMTTSNFLYVLVGGLYGAVGKRRILMEQRERQVNVVLSCFFAFCMVMGNIENVLEANVLFPWPITVLVCCYGFYLCFSLLIEAMLVYFRSIRVNVDIEERTGKQIVFCFLLAFILLVIVWGIGLAISYPANTTADSNGIINTALLNEKMKAAVPIVYVLAIRYLWNLGYALFGTPNASLAVCSIAHIIMLAFIVAYLVSRLYKYRVKKSVCVIVWLFYAIVPYNVQFSHTIWKDVPFAAFTFLLMILIWEHYIGEPAGTKMSEYGKLFLILISAIGMCLMRNNGLFAYLFFLPFGLCLFFKKNKKVVVTLVAAYVLVRIIQGPIYDDIMTDNVVKVDQKLAEQQGMEIESDYTVAEVKNATDSYNASGIYIITVQQFARIAVVRTDLSVEDYQRLGKIIDIEKVQEKYKPHIRDSAARCVNYDVPMKEYIKEWIYFGCKYPVDFFLAWKDQTYGYWYPDIQYWVYTDQIRENDLGLYKDSILSDDARYEWLTEEENYKRIPIYGMLWSIGFVVWLTILFAGVSYVKKGLKAVLPYIPVLGVWATLLVATPVYAEFRYIYSIFLCLPLSILIPFIGKKEYSK